MMQEELAVPIVVVLHHPQANLVQMTQAVHPPSRFTRPLHRRQQQTDEHRDQRDHHQELDQRESRPDPA
jgi:hypothetical protein